MPKKPSNSRTVATASAIPPLPDGLVSDEPISYPVAGTAVTALQVYRNPDRRPTGHGPWDGEADKIAWVDAETGLGCIILRQKNGTLSGYIGVGPDHPLFGFTSDAVPLGLASSVHGGITYAKACEVNLFARVPDGDPRQERYSVCHVTRVRLVQDYRTVQTTKNEFEHEDLWWLGFDTSHIGDLIPKGYATQRKGDVYRDQAFVYGQCIELARRLRVIADIHNSSVDEADIKLRLLPPSIKGGE